MGHRCSTLIHNRSSSEDSNGIIPQPSRSFKSDDEQISALLLQAPPQWTGASRFWAVAHLIGEVEAFQPLVTEHGFSDVQLPITKSTLKSYIKDEELTRRFLDKQDLVETEFINLNGKGMANRHFVVSDAGVTFEFLEEIGEGGCGSVWKVEHKKDRKVYAVKRLLRCSVKEQIKRPMETFLNEIKVMIELNTFKDRHCHLVKFHGWYTDYRYIGLITSPVAQYNLREYLNVKQTKEIYNTTRSLYGCLASAVKWLHSHNVKHKDIKPANILVSEGCVFLIDFGISQVYDSKENSNTEGESRCTSHYASKEVIEGELKGLALDIWSLGRTYIDICGALHGISPKSIVNRLHTTGTGDTRACYNLDGLSLLLEQLRDREHSADSDIIDCIELMMQPAPEDRIEASDLTERILNAGHQFCGKCCRQQ